MVMYGIIYALLENDIRRILAFSIVNQVGFMVCAVGIGTQMAINGAAAHAFAHIIYKALLFMSAGVVVYRTGFNKCTEVGGLFRTMPLTAVCGIIGALAISGFPLTSGFTTKTLISQGAADEGLVAVYFLLAAASAGVFLHAGIKFPWFVFFQRDSGLRPKDAPWNMAVAMVFFSVLCILFGVAPQLLYPFLPYPVDYQAYAPGKVVFYLQLLLFSGLAFFLLLPMMKRTNTLTLDTDWLWRIGLNRAWIAIESLLGRAGAWLAEIRQRLLGRMGATAQRYFGGSPRGVFAQAWPIGTTAIWIAVLLTAYVIFYYIG
jgi:multicomponent Na+:H+ antiporter subunit D